MFSLCPSLLIVGGGLGCCCTLDGVVGSSRDGGVANRTRGLGVTMSLRAGLLTTGVSVRFGFSLVDTVAVELCKFGDPAHCALFEGKMPVPTCFFAMAAHFSTLLMASLTSG